MTNIAYACLLYTSGDEYDIKVRYAPEFRESVEDLENILIYNNEGKGIRIRDLGKVVERMTPPTIERKDRERVITRSRSLRSMVGGVIRSTTLPKSRMRMPLPSLL